MVAKAGDASAGPAVSRAWWLLALLLASGTSVCQAGELPEHWHLVYFAARTAGYRPADAFLIADASWAVDQNDDTVATGHLQELVGWVATEPSPCERDGDALLREALEGPARLLSQGALMHALAPDDSRRAVRRLFSRWIDDTVRRYSGPRRRELRMILFGMYLHYVVDSYVHPKQAYPGHAWQEHQPDRTPNNKPAFTAAAVDVYSLLAGAAGELTDGDLESREWVDLPPAPAGGEERLFAAVIDAIADAYAATEGSIRQRSLTARMDPRVPAADLAEVAARLENLWRLNGFNTDFGEQRRQDRGAAEVGFVVYRVNPRTGEMAIRWPRLAHTWRVTSFVEFVRRERADGLDDEQRAAIGALRNEALRVACDGTLFATGIPDGVVQPVWDAVRSGLTVVVGGSGSAAGQLVPPPFRRVVGPSDVLRRIVFEVRDRQWATDGLEKYLAPDRSDDSARRLTVPPHGAVLTRDLKEEIDSVLQGGANATLVIETLHSRPDSGSDSRAAEIVRYAVEQKSTVRGQPGAVIFAHGSGANVLTHMPPDASRIERRVVISPVHEPATIPAGVTVVLPKETRFMNFDTGSPGYRRLLPRVQEYATHFDVITAPSTVVTSGAAAPVVPMEYYARGAGASVPIRLTNTPLTEIVTRSASDPGAATLAMQEILRAEQTEKPSTVGGISLVTSATFPVKAEDVAGATFDRATNRIVLRMRDGSARRLPPMDPELVRIAYDCLYGRGIAPELSIGVDPNPRPINAGRPGRVRVHYVGAIAGTRLGRIMLDADQLLARLTFGGSDVIDGLGLPGSGLHTLAELFPDRYAAPTIRRYGNSRVYLVPSRVALAEAGAGELRFADVRFDIRLDPFGPAEEHFARAMAAHWDELLRAPGGAPFRELVEPAKIVAVFNWLDGHLVPFDDSLAEVEVRRFFTPMDLVPDRPTDRGSLRPALPLVMYGRDGIERVFGADGAETRLIYRHGRVAEVRRSDGRVLRIYVDDAGDPVAIGDSGAELGAAFFRDDRTRRYAMADLVRLHFAGSRYSGFERTARSRALYEVVPEDLIATIIANFIAEAHPRQGLPSRGIGVAEVAATPPHWPVATIILIGIAAAVTYGLRRRP